MNIYKPYTYLIGWSKLNKYYYGVRFAKNCNPDELFVSYFTSSKQVKRFRDLYGEPDIIQVRKIFTNKDSAIRFESGVLTKLKVRNNSRWLNVTDTCAIDNSGMCFYNNGIVSTLAFESPGPEWLPGKFVSDQTKRKQSITTKQQYKDGRVSPFKGKSHSNETKLHLSLQKTGENNPFYGKKRPEHSEKMKIVMKGKPKSDKHKESISKSHNVIYTCPHCSQSGSRLLLRWHFGHCRFKV